MLKNNSPHYASSRVRARMSMLLGALLFVSAGVAHADRNDFDDFDSLEEKKKEKITVVMPSFPDDADLLPFPTSSLSSQSFFVDAKSIRVDKNQTVFYTLVSQSSSGAKNISYEAIRCESFEYRQFAYGLSNGTWMRAKNDRWSLLSTRAYSQPRVALTHDYFCEIGMVAGDENDIISRIRNQKRLERY